MTKIKKNKFPLISPLLFAGILLVLLPIFTFMTLDRLERQKDFFTQRLLEKGRSLIRTFEAGTRTGLFTMGWGAKRVQTMLYETSLQPEIVYMMIISEKGKILAHSDASLVGNIFQDMPDITNIKKSSVNQDRFLFNYRVREQKDQVKVFEVFKRFSPIGRKFKGRHRMSEMLMRREKIKLDFSGSEIRGQDWCRTYLNERSENIPQKTQHYIFAGLSMEREKSAKSRLLKQTIWRGFFFFVLGGTGIIALLIFQAFRSAKASLSSVKAFSDNVIENMPSGLIAVNLDYEITSMNRAAKDILGSDVEDFLPQLIELIKQPEISQEIIHKEINFAVNKQLNKQAGKVLSTTQDKTIGLDITASFIKDYENELTGFLFLFKDLTQIKELKKQVETNRRLAAIGKLAAGVAHEIRNPLSSIKGFATYFGTRYENNSSDKQTAQIMVKEVERINRSITQLLEFAKPMSIEKKSMNISDLIEHSLKLVHHDIVQKNIHTKIDLNIKKPMIYSDGDRVNQVLLNLYINAIQALE
ncbi:PAS domain-containing protein, partial [bacterium]|nr:PAS domain-containing protein [bacterium]